LICKLNINHKTNLLQKDHPTISDIISVLKYSLHPKNIDEFRFVLSQIFLILTMNSKKIMNIDNLRNDVSRFVMKPTVMTNIFFYLNKLF